MNESVRHVCGLFLGVERKGLARLRQLLLLSRSNCSEWQSSALRPRLNFLDLGGIFKKTFQKRALNQKGLTLEMV
jgi:hypothetical protein